VYHLLCILYKHNSKNYFSFQEPHLLTTVESGSAVRAAIGRPYCLKEENILYKT